jgi:AraC-like DNA-binding protein
LVASPNHHDQRSGRVNTGMLMQQVSPGWSGQSVPRPRGVPPFSVVPLAGIVIRPLKQYHSGFSPSRDRAFRNSALNAMVRAIVPLAEGGSILHDGQERPLHTGDVILLPPRCDTLRWGGELRSGLVMEAPADLFRRRVALEPLCGPYLLDGRAGIGAIAASMIGTICREADATSPEDRIGLRDALIEVLASALRTMRNHEQPAASLIQKHCAVIKAFIDDHLQDHELEPRKVAAAYKISVRHLHRLFRSTNKSFGEWLRERRLERCREDLASLSMSGLSVSEIAFRWGFNDPSHFSRLFKAVYGQTPRAYRNAERTGAAAA